MAKRKAKNSNLTRAKKAKNDEFYTQASDVEKELKHYRQYFKNKVIYCNCDDPTYSEFWRYFHLNFHFLGLKELISTHYDEGKPTYALFYRGGRSEQDDGHFDSYDEKKDLKQDGDFRSEESIELLKRCDIVVTNPPFSYFRDFVAQLVKYKKKFIIWGNLNAITYKEIFPLLQNNKIWIGITANKTCTFRLSDDYKKWNKKITEQMNDGHKYGNVPSITVYTNIPVDKPTDRAILFKQFNLNDFPVYDNYAAFNVDKVVNIPVDHQITVTLPLERLTGFQKTYGDDLQVLSQDENTVTMQITRPIWGVPITFMDKYNPSILEREQFGKSLQDHRTLQSRLRQQMGLGQTKNQEQRQVQETRNQVTLLKDSMSGVPLKVKAKDSQMESLMKIQEQHSHSSIINVNTNAYSSNRDNMAERFHLLGETGGTKWNNINEIKTTITYKNAKQHNPNGTITNGSKVNTRATIITNKNGRYYTADNTKDNLQVLYARLLIRERKDYEKD